MPWLQVYGFITLHRCYHQANTEEAGMPKHERNLRLWQAVGLGLELDEDSLRQELASSRSAEMGGLVGSSWVRCPLFESFCMVSGREPERCSRCKAVRLVRSRSQPLCL